MSRIDWNRNQPIIHHIRQVLPEVFQVLSTAGHGAHRSGVGGYNNRNIRGTDTPSDHAEGRAADIYLSAFVDIEKQIGDALFHMFIEHATELGVDYVIWNYQIWSVAEGGPREFRTRPHTDHVHVSFTRLGSQKKPPELREYAEAARMTILQSLRSEIAAGA